MSVNDPFFDAWVREMLRGAEARPPEHLWDVIRRDSRFYVVRERHKYLLVLLLLLLVTGSLAWWGIHPLVRDTRNVSKVAAASRDMSTPRMPDTRPVISGHRAAMAEALRITPENAMPAMAAHATPETAAAVDGPKITLNTTAPAGDASPTAIDAIPAADLKHTPLGPALSLSPEGDPLKSNARPLLSVKRRNHTYIELYAGPDHATHYITAANTQYKEYVQQTKGAVMPYPSFSLGVNVDLPLFGDNWRLRTGLHYFQINEQLHYYNPAATKTVNQITTRSVVQPSGQIVLVSDTAQVTYKGTYVKQSLNAYRGIDIPLIISRTLIGNPQFQLDGSVGTFVNLAAWYTGDILDTTNEPAALHRGADRGTATWKKNIGASLYGSLSIRDRLTNRIQISLEPYIRYELGPINQEVGVYKERFVTTGLALGLRYALGR